MLTLTTRQLAIVKEIVRDHLGTRPVKVFGSRATDTAKAFPDLDLLVMGEPLTAQQRGAADEAFDESDLPFRVDIVEAARIDPSFLQVIEAQSLDLA